MKWNFWFKLIFIVIVKIDCYGGFYIFIIVLLLIIIEVELNISIFFYGVFSGIKNSGFENWCIVILKSIVFYEWVVNKIKMIWGKWNIWFMCLVFDMSIFISGSCEIIVKNSVFD